MIKEKRKFDGYVHGLIRDRTFPIERTEKFASWEFPFVIYSRAFLC
jgi:hypothetical protein